jgi:hypothetical protein
MNRFSPHGHSAILMSTSAGRLQIVSGLPDAPVIVREVDAGLLPEPLRALAVSDDASCVLLSSPEAVYRLSATGWTSVVSTVTAVASLAFFPDSTSGGPRSRTLRWRKRPDGQQYQHRRLARHVRRLVAPCCRLSNLIERKTVPAIRTRRGCAVQAGARQPTGDDREERLAALGLAAR